MPQYSLSESSLDQVLVDLSSESIEVNCTIQRHEITNQSMYRGWEIKSSSGTRVIMWDEYPLDRAEEDFTVFVTIGTPNGKNGMKLLTIVHQALMKCGAKKNELILLN